MTETNEKLVIRLSPSGLDSIQGCPLSYHYAKGRRLELVDDKPKMERGRLFHLILERHYKLILKGEKPQDFWPAVWQSILPETAKSNLPSEEINKTRSAYEAYVREYAFDPLRPVENGVEAPFSIVIHEDDEVVILIEGKVDLLAKGYNDNLVIVDHKTKERKGFYSILANQFRIYSLALGVDTVIVNEVLFQKEVKFRRIPLTFQVAFLEELKTTLYYESKQLLAYVKTGYWPPRHVSCKFCDFKMICETTPEARENKIKMFYREKPAFDLFPDEEKDDEG